MRRAPLPLTALVVALVVALSACGGSSTEIGDLPADAVFLSAVDASTDISTVRVEYESTSRRDGEVLNIGRGEAVFAPGAASFTMDAGGVAGEGDVSEDRYYELRIVDGTVYIRMPELVLGMAGGDPSDAQWIVYPADEVAEMIAQFEQFDFATTLQALRDSAELSEDGRETIAGVATTRYVGTTTLRSVLQAQGSTEEQLEQQASMAEEFGDGGAGLDEPMPLTVWIGDDGLIRRYDYTTDDGEFETTQSLTVLEYGLEVDIAAPPAEETVSAEEFESSYQSSSQSFGSEFDVEELESDGTIVFESEGSATAESSATAEGSVTDESAPAPEAATDSDG